MTCLENEYTFGRVRLDRIDIIKTIFNKEYGKGSVHTYKKVSFKDEFNSNIQYRLFTLDGKKFYQTKTRIGHFILSITNDPQVSLLTSREGALNITKHKTELNKMNKLETVVMDRYDWLNGMVSLRYDSNSAYVEFEVGEEEREIDFDRFKFIYKTVYDKSYIKSDILAKGEIRFQNIKNNTRNPIPIQKNRRFIIDLFQKPFIIRPKTDGIHGFLMNIENETYVWFVNESPIRIKRVFTDDILEVEYVDDNTIIYIDNLTSAKNMFEDRYRIDKMVLRDFKHIIFRPYKLFEESKKDMLRLFEQFKKTKAYIEYESDGLIIHSTERYTSDNSFVYKYKISEDNTIDMILMIDGLKVSLGGRGGLVNFKGSKLNPFDFDFNDYKDVPIDVVSEWRFNKDTKIFDFMRERRDKVFPNIESTAVSNWDSIFLDMEEFFGSSSTKRVNYIVNTVKGYLIDDDVDAYEDWGSGSAGTAPRYPRNKFCLMTEMDPRNALEARKRLRKGKYQNIIFKMLNYLEDETVEMYWKWYMDTCNSVQITNFITISHQSIAEIPKLHKLWSTHLKKSNVKKITIMYIDGKHILYMKRKGMLKDVGVDTTQIDGDRYRTSIGTTTTADFEEYLYDGKEYWKDIEKSGIEVVLESVESLVDFPIDYLNNSEVEWLRCHYVATLTLTHTF